ncbi:MAG: glycoside hydrolase family 19 protein [Pseudomonadota bacterium]
MSPDILARAVGCSVDLAEKWADPLDAAMTEYGILSRLRAAMFLAQIGHETGGFHWITELWGPTPAQKGYEGSADLGNVKPGDGALYRGRGLIQVTGRANYAAARDRLRKRLGEQVPDFERDPIDLCYPEWASYSAGDYWDSRHLNAKADAGDVLGVTRAVNGGTNGLADRQARYDQALKVLL